MTVSEYLAVLKLISDNGLQDKKLKVYTTAHDFIGYAIADPQDGVVYFSSEPLPAHAAPLSSNLQSDDLYTCVALESITVIELNSDTSASGGDGTQGPQGEPGPAGPTAVSTDADNLADLGSDDLLYVPNKFAFKGITDATDANPGDVGEYKVIDNIAGVDLIANTAAAICTLPLPAGCWEVWGACDFNVPATQVETQAGAPIQPNQLGAAISITPDSLPTDEELILGTGVMQLIYSPLAAGQRQVLITGQCRSNSNTPVDLYLVAQIGLGNVNVKGYISARRVR